MKIKELPETERPYEKLELYGEKALSNAELLAIIIKTGTKKNTALDIANQILKLNQGEDIGDLNFLRDLRLEELKNLRGIGRVKAIQIKAMCEIATRMSRKRNYRKIQINGPNDIAKLLMEDLRFEKREMVKLVIINNKNVVLKILDVAVGNGNCSTINIGYILSEVIKINAPRMILVHNHPSGDPTPSQSDKLVTEKLRQAAKIVNIELLDHIIIGNLRYRSIMQCEK